MYSLRGRSNIRHELASANDLLAVVALQNAYERFDPLSGYCILDLSTGLEITQGDIETYVWFYSFVVEESVL